MKNFREIENLSAYLDGQLDSKESTQLESRLKSDPELESALRDLSAARNILRKLPQRKAPRNFTLTRQMAGLKPPLPRSYPLIRFATVFASVLFLFSLTATALSPYVSFGYGGAAAPAAAPFGMGGGCDGPCEDAAMEQPAATEEAFAAEMAPAAEEPAASAEDGARTAEPTPALKQPEESSAEQAAAETANQPEVEQEARIFNPWVLIFLAISLTGFTILWLMRQSAKRTWR